MSSIQWVQVQGSTRGSQNGFHLTLAVPLRALGLQGRWSGCSEG